MSELPRASKYRATPQAEVTDAERERLLGRLNDAFSAGAVAERDYARFLDTVFAARTLGELVDVVEALPAEPTHETPDIVAVGEGRPGELAEARAPGGRALAVVVGLGLVAVVLLLILVLGLAL